MRREVGSRPGNLMILRITGNPAKKRGLDVFFAGVWDFFNFCLFSWCDLCTFYHGNSPFFTTIWENMFLLVPKHPTSKSKLMKIQ